MDAQNTGKARYYAFISHKSTDSRFALKLQKFIESYNLPVNICRMAGLQSRRLTPLCSYEVDFSSSPLLDEMQDKLKRSNHLILLCSEELLKSDPKYIDYEIRTFIECKKAEGIDPLSRIIPIIVTGEFGSADHECCPEALRELGENCPIALDRKKYKNDRELFLHVISSLLNIDYAVIENRDKKRQRTKRGILGAALILLLVAGIALGSYFIPRKKHYVDFVMKDGLPQGIGTVSEDDSRKMRGHYVITWQKHKIQSLEYVNAYGNRIDHNGNIYDGDRPSGYRFAYTGSQLSAVTYEDKFGVPYFILQYSGNSISSADLRNPYDPAEAYYIGSSYESDPAMLLADVNLTSHSDISRFRYEYSPEGYVTGIVFCSDSTGRLAQDNSVYGFEYVLDEKGRIVETYFLDALGERRLNSEGIYCRKFMYDDRDDLVQWFNCGENGSPAADAEGIVHCRYVYDNNHNLKNFSFFDETGVPVSISSYGGTGQNQYVDDRGNLILAEFLDETGAISQSLPYCAMAFTYDEHGFIASRTFLTHTGEAVMDPSVNYATIQYTSDDIGNALERTYHDTEGNLINNAYGFAREVMEYDADGREQKHTYFTADGSYANYREFGYSSLVTTYDERSREISQSYFGPKGEPVNISGPIFAFGYHKLETVYEYGAHTKQTLSYYDADGNSVNMVSSLGEEYARSVAYIQNGEITHMANYRKDGSIYGPVLEAETHHSAQAEPIKTYRYTDGNDNLLQESITRYRLDGVENEKTFTVYHANGSIAEVQETLYHENGQFSCVNATQYDENGSILTEYRTEYDTQGKKIRETLLEPANEDTPVYIVESFYEESGTLTQEIHTGRKEDESISFTTIYSFRPDGSKEAVATSLFDEAGKLLSQTENVYESGAKISATEYTYNAQEIAVMVTVTRYHSDGTVASREFRDCDDTGLPEAVTEFLYHPDGTVTQTTTFYDESGNIDSVSQRLLDENNNVKG